MKKAPWTDDEVESLEAFQAAGFVHPFTGEDGGILIPTKEGWRPAPGAPVCQDWAHDFMLDWSWKPAIIGGFRWPPSSGG